VCGIVGYAGADPAQDVLVQGLLRLEYRGYDSAGLAVVSGDGSIARVRTAGRVERLVDATRRAPLPGRVGIGHTRWATHGAPTERNAHPHLDCRGRFAVVHNGIIDNHAELRARLQADGHVFASDTDTEVVAHLLEETYAGDLLEALRQAAVKLRGTYAIAAVSVHEPGRVAAVRHGNPLVVGLGQGENYLASDLPAVLDRTRDGLPLEDGDAVAITADGVRIVDREGHERRPAPFRVNWTPAQAERGGHPHFLHKEIHEQPEALRATLAGRVEAARGEVRLAEFEGVDLSAVGRLRLVACGTSYHAARVGELLFERLAGVEARAELASEFRYRRPLLARGEPALCISQSGETLDTLEAAREARRLGHPVWAITNVLGSSLGREADHGLLTQAGPEISVASTKAFTTQILALSLIAVAVGRANGHLPAPAARAFLRDLEGLPEAAEEVIAASREAARQVAERLREVPDAFFLGRDLDLPVALEGALKLKEISYIHAEAYAGGEMKHGPLALLGPGVPVVAVLTQAQVADKMAANAVEAVTRGAWPVSVVREDLAGRLAPTFTIPAGHDLTRPALAVLPLQLLAYEAAVARGTDVDRPRNLAKSVTVE
jgi:glucosamine--fructose-6-phosphate aminotransferase (isomerizing)